jgi:anti-anti-sigma factor
VRAGPRNRRNISMNNRPKPFFVAAGEKIFIGNADNLAAIAGPHLEPAHPTAAVVVDMSGIIECDSYGLRVLLALLKKANLAKKRFLLYRPSPVFVEMMTLLNLRRIFSITNNADGD